MKKDFIAKVYISFKEASETEYWLELLYRTKYLTSKEYQSLKNDISEISKMLTATIKTAKKNNS